ncbi:MAG: hypothetical protein ACREIB_02060, partial [Pseudomonadota bacterium]
MRYLPWVFAAMLAACGGGEGGEAPPPPPAPPTDPGRVSIASPFSPTCGLSDGTVYINAEVEPYVAVNPRNAANLVGIWQQDRWSNGSARGLLTGVTFDGGTTWVHRQVPWSMCSGGPYQRATDP